MLRSLGAVAVLVLGITTADATILCDRFGCRQNAAQAAYTGRGRVISGRPAGCPRAWCGCWLARYKGLKDRSLWLARNWTRVGRPAPGPAPGIIAIYARGRRGGHVGIVRRVVRPGVIVLLSGNDGGLVRERARSTQGVIAWRIL